MAHPAIEQTSCNKSLVEVAKKILGHNIELQHSKLNAKPQKDEGDGLIPWHQDFPFFPHTNTDLLACGIHLDEELVDSGPMEFLEGSHKLGILSHIHADGTFAGECTEYEIMKKFPLNTMTVPKGAVSFHSSLALHRSAPKKNNLQRRLIVFQYRATDAAQLAGVIWECTGRQVDGIASSDRLSFARFNIPGTIELRGKGGRLYDVKARLAPNK